MYLLSTLVTASALVLYQATAFKVATARRRFGIPAPKIQGDEQFERIYRVQMNTLEQLVFFLPVLWLCTVQVGDGFAALLGIIWVFGRGLYARGYYLEAAQRHQGFMISFFASIILLIAGVIGALV